MASLRLVVAGHRKAEVLQALRSLQGPTSVQAGCVDCRILEDVDDETLIFYVEEWGTREQLVRHIRSDHYTRLLAIIEMSSGPPDLRYDTISRRQGLELVEAVRGSTNLLSSGARGG